MDIPLPQLGLVLGLVVVNAVFAGSEIALISLREGQLRRLGESGGRGQTLVRLARDPNRFLATIQIGITLAGFLASAAAAATLAQPLEEPLSFFGSAAEPVAVVAVTLVLTYITLVFGELAPKRVALQRSEGWALLAARPLAVLSSLSRPVVWLLSHSTDLAVRLLGGDPEASKEEVSDEEIRDMVASQSGFSAEQRAIIDEVFEVAERSVREVLVPRTRVVSFLAEQPADEVLAGLVESGHSRAPVHTGDLDHVVGVAHLRDLVGAEGSVGSHVRPVTVVPETVGVLDTLRRLQRERQELAVVVSEHGGVEGLVTTEDLLEEFVGDIYDEFDRDLSAVTREPDGAILLPGSFPIHDTGDLDLDLPQGDYATVAGLVLERLGRIPAPGDAVEVDGWRLEVVDMDRRAVRRLRIRPQPIDPRPPS